MSFYRDIFMELRQGGRHPAYTLGYKCAIIEQVRWVGYYPQETSNLLSEVIATMNLDVAF